MRCDVDGAVQVLFGGRWGLVGGGVVGKDGIPVSNPMTDANFEFSIPIIVAVASLRGATS